MLVVGPKEAEIWNSQRRHRSKGRSSAKRWPEAVAAFQEEAQSRRVS